METYVNESWGISVPYPAGWEVEEEAEIVAFIGRQSGFVVHLLDMTDQDKIPLEMLVDMLVQKAWDSEDVESVGEVERCAIGGQEGAGFVEISKDPDTGKQFQSYFAVVYHPSGQKVYVLRAIMPAALWDETQPIFEAIFDGVKFTPL
jgi:hypothetical protein